LALSDALCHAELLAQHLSEVEAALRRRNDLVRGVDLDIQRRLAAADDLGDLLRGLHLKLDDVDAVGEVGSVTHERVAGAVDPHDHELAVGSLGVGEHLEVVAPRLLHVRRQNVEVVDDHDPEVGGLGQHRDVLDVRRLACGQDLRPVG
jgi:hypothetical protein